MQPYMFITMLPFAVYFEGGFVLSSPKLLGADDPVVAYRTIKLLLTGAFIAFAMVSYSVEWSRMSCLQINVKKTGNGRIPRTAQHIKFNAFSLRNTERNTGALLWISISGRQDELD